MAHVLFVRHADVPVPASSNNPPLTAAGKTRAKTLAQVAGVAGVSTIWTSTYIRTKQTAQPLATLLGLPAQEVPANFAQLVTNGTAGPVVLIAGHTDTVPQMMTALGVPGPPPVIGELEFDNLFVVHVTGPGQATMVRLKYGKLSS